MNKQTLRWLSCAVGLAIASPADSQEPPSYEQAQPTGYKRDDAGRLMQTHFDLRRRYMAGVHWAGGVDAADGELTSATALEVGGAFELYQERKSRRTKFRYLEGRLQIQDLEIDTLLFDYSVGRRSAEPVFWITTFIGEPRRFDVAIDIAPGVMLGRFWVGPLDGRRMLLADIGDVHLDWELAHGPNLEDYLAVRVATGAGLRTFTGEDSGGGVAGYLYPEVGVRAAWLMGDRGLTQLGFDGRLRAAWEPASEVRWFESRAAIGLERILIAVSDQPVALFIQPGLKWINAPGGEELEARVDVGVRLSLFAPPRDPDDQCPDAVEDFDYVDDEDGCPEPD